MGTHRELSNEYEHDSLDGLKKSLRPCALDEGSYSIERVNEDYAPI